MDSNEREQGFTQVCAFHSPLIRRKSGKVCEADFTPVMDQPGSGD
jgi:hypothetical protein